MWSLVLANASEEMGSPQSSQQEARPIRGIEKIGAAIIIECTEKFEDGNAALCARIAQVGILTRCESILYMCSLTGIAHRSSFIFSSLRAFWNQAQELGFDVNTLNSLPLKMLCNLDDDDSFDRTCLWK